MRESDNYREDRLAEKQTLKEEKSQQKTEKSESRERMIGDTEKKRGRLAASQKEIETEDETKANSPVPISRSFSAV